MRSILNNEQYPVEASYHAELKLWTGGLPEEIDGYLLTKAAAESAFDGVAIDDMVEGTDYITPTNKFRRALEEVAHLTTRVPIPEDGDVRGWEQVCPKRVKQIAAVVKTALGEATE